VLFFFLFGLFLFRTGEFSPSLSLSFIFKKKNEVAAFAEPFKRSLTLLHHARPSITLFPETRPTPAPRRPLSLHPLTPSPCCPSPVIYEKK
jgi:hypothetical protein